MQMNESEIKANVLQAKDQKAQIQICADLNAIPVSKVKEILRKQGVDLRTLNGSRDMRRKTSKVEVPEGNDTDKTFLQLFNRVNELMAQKEAIVKELSEIKLQITKISKAIDGEEV